jgi:hypothetical protein
VSKVTGIANTRETEQGLALEGTLAIIPNLLPKLSRPRPLYWVRLRKQGALMARGEGRHIFFTRDTIDRLKEYLKNTFGGESRGLSLTVNKAVSEFLDRADAEATESSKKWSRDRSSVCPSLLKGGAIMEQLKRYGNSIHVDTPHTSTEILTLDIHREDMYKYADLIPAAVNACLKVNEDNPMAVAEGLGEFIEAFKTLKFQFASAVEKPYSKDKEVYKRADDALAAITKPATEENNDRPDKSQVWQVGWW